MLGKLFLSFFFCLALGLVHPLASILPVSFLLINFGRNGEIVEMFLFFLLILIFADNRAGLEGGMKMNRIFGVLILSYFTFTSNSFSSSPFLKNMKWLLPFWLCLFISWLFSPGEIKVAVLLRTISYGLLPLVIFGLFLPYFKAFPHKLMSIVNFSVVVLVLGFVLYLIAPQYVQSIGEDNAVRISGLLGNANGLAMFTVFFSIIHWYAQDRLNLFSKTNYLGIMILFFLMLIVSGSRTSLGVFVLFHGLRYINYKPGGIRIFLKYVITPIVLLFMFSVGYRYVQQSQALSGRARLDTLETMGGRMIGWQWGYQQVPKALYFGKGLLYDSYIYQNSFSSELRAIQRGLNAAYSGVLALLLDVGIIGAFFFIIFFIGMFSQFKDKRLILPLLLGFSLSFLFESWMLATLQPFTSLFYLIIGLFQTDWNTNLV